jgi:Carboxypeptidase regulatory-like domain
MLDRWKLVLLALGGVVAAGSAQAQSTIADTGAVSGTVTATKLFTAAQVYLRNAEKGVTFMVYTAGGKYQAINLYPGVYDVHVARRGFSSDPQKITVAPGAMLKLDFALTDADPAPKAGINGPSTIVGYPGRATIIDKDVEFSTNYEAVYPAGPGREVLEKTCMGCHGVNFFAVRALDRSAWDALITRMTKRNEGMDTSVPPGKLSPRDRQLLLDYLATNMGPDSKKRALAIATDMPLDEAALGKAMYIEYEMPKVGPNGRPIGQGKVWY